VAMNNAHLNLR